MYSGSSSRSMTSRGANLGVQNCVNLDWLDISGEEARPKPVMFVWRRFFSIPVKFHKALKDRGFTLNSSSFQTKSMGTLAGVRFPPLSALDAEQNTSSWYSTLRKRSGKVWRALTVMRHVGLSGLKVWGLHSFSSTGINHGDCRSKDGISCCRLGSPFRLLFESLHRYHNNPTVT
jgi:hypothetical protein